MQKNTTTKDAQAQPCPDCGGKGYTRQVWYTDDGSPAYILRPACRTCKGEKSL